MKIAELFYSIQGEGKLSGVPSVFIRASGCNLRCTWCDTPYASWHPEGTDQTIPAIMEQVRQHPARHVVLTGGEPLIMPDVVELCAAIKLAGYHLTIETAATVYQAAKVDLASLSPKLSNSTPTVQTAGAMASLHEKNRLSVKVIQRLIDESPDFQLKFVVTDQADLGEIHALLDDLKDWTPADVLLMPEGIDPATLTSRAGWVSQLCKQHGFRYCPRLHVELYGNRRGT